MISRAVVLSWMSAFARLELAGEEPAVLVGEFLRLHVHAEALLRARRQHDLGARYRIICRRSTEKLSAMVTTSG
jgi:hypothetical protein